MEKNILYVILVAIGIYWLISMLYFKPQMPVDYKNKIDSLSKINSVLLQKQNQLDSTINNYQVQIYDLDYKLSNIKEKTTVVKEYYHEVSRETQSYNTTQVDSFLRNRFNY
jgi:predicted nuclease with TOPRIM domain